MSTIEQTTRQEQADILAKHLPANKCYEAKNIEGSVLRKILFGLAGMWLRMRDYTKSYYNEYNPATTTDLITQWEREVGIPDSCFPVVDSLEDRRRNILLKIASLKAETNSQIQAIADILGLNISIANGVESTTISDDLIIPFTILGEDTAPFTIIVNVSLSGANNAIISDDLIIPFTIGDNVSSIFECLIFKIKPCNTLIIINYI